MAKTQPKDYFFHEFKPYVSYWTKALLNKNVEYFVDLDTLEKDADAIFESQQEAFFQAFIWSDAKRLLRLPNDYSARWDDLATRFDDPTEEDWAVLNNFAQAIGLIQNEPFTDEQYKEFFV